MSIEQIMAECGCENSHNCERVGFCIEDETDAIDARNQEFKDFMELPERERWYILWDAAGMPK